MKILFIVPPIRDFYDTPIRHFPLGLLYLKSSLDKFHPECKVEILDARHNRGKKTISLPKELKGVKQFYPANDITPFRTFYHYYHFGLSFEAIQKIIIEKKPDLIGITSMFSTYFQEVEQLCQMIKAVLPNCKIVVGGAHPSSMPDQVLSNNNTIDYLVAGEGEKGIVELIDYMQGKRKIEDVSSLGYKNGSQIFLNKKSNFSVHQIPSPTNIETHEMEYKIKNVPMAMIQTSRGCPYKCSFCTTHDVFGHLFRQRDVEDIIDEMKNYFQKGIRAFDFEDDNLTLRKDFMIKLCKQITHTFPGKMIELFAMNGVSYWHLDQDMLNLMWEAGFRIINLSLVSGNRQQSLIRPMDMELFCSVAKMAFNMGFKITGYYILGLPNQTIDEDLDSLTLLAQLPLEVGASPFYLLPGSPISMEKEFSHEELIQGRLTAMANMSKSVYTLFIMTRVINFLKTLPLKEDIHYKDLLDKKWDSSWQLGIDVLNRFFTENVFYSYNKEKAFYKNEAVILPLLQKFYSIKMITAYSGFKIILPVE